jgi:hypothetical protein
MQFTLKVAVLECFFVMHTVSWEHIRRLIIIKF